MGGRTLPPQVEGPCQGRLEMILGRPAVFPTPRPSQTFVFTFRWWGDTHPCVIRLPPDKGEVRVTYYVTCSPRSFRQYLLDAGSLHVSVRIEGEGKAEDTEEEQSINRELQNLKRTGIETPRQKILKRRLRQKKGWLDGDVVGTFMLPDMKLNTRGDCVQECRIVDTSADVMGTVVVTLVFLEGSPERLHQARLPLDMETSPQESKANMKPKPKVSGIPVREIQASKIPRQADDGMYRQRSRSSSFKSTQRPNLESLKSPKKRATSSSMDSYHGKENEVPIKDREPQTMKGRIQEPQATEGKDREPQPTGGMGQEPPVVRRRDRGENHGGARERPASWGLYPLLNGADPYALVESGAIRKEDLPVLLQVLEGHSPNPDLSSLDPDTQKLLDGLDLSMSFSGMSTAEGGFGRADRCKGNLCPPTFSVFNHKDGADFSGVSMTSGVWPIDEQEDRSVGTTRGLMPSSPRSPRKHAQPSSARTKVPSSHSVAKGGGGPARCLTPRPDRQPSKDEPGRKTPPPPEEGSVLAVEVGVLTLSSLMLLPQPPDKEITGAKVKQRSKVCHLTSLEVQLPGVDIPPEWDLLQQTCASRELNGDEVQYQTRLVLRLPPAPAIDILRGHLTIRSVRRFLGEKDSEEVGSASVSMMEIWQLSGSVLQVPLFRSEILDGRDSLSRRIKARRKEEEGQRQSYASLTFTPRLALAIGHSSGEGRLLEQLALQQKMTGAVRTSDVPKEKVNMPRLRDYTHGPPGTPPPRRRHNESVMDGIRPVKPQPMPPDTYEPLGSAVFNSIYLPTHVSPRDKLYGTDWQYPRGTGRVEVMEGFIGAPGASNTLSAPDPRLRIYQGSFLAGINGHEPQSNQPLESGGESPCIRTLGDFHADFLEHALLNRRSSIEMRQEENKGSCKVHLEILKGRNFPWVESMDGTSKPPSCYVRATIGSHNIQTNICLESDNPMWNFAADVLLPYSQLSQADGNLILKVHHGTWDQPPSLEDPLIGFVCVDATSIWSGHVSLCGWYPLMDLRGCVRGHLKVSLTPHEPPTSGPPRKAHYSVSLAGQKGPQDHFGPAPPPREGTDISRRESLRTLSSNVRCSPRGQRKSYSNPENLYNISNADTSCGGGDSVCSKASVISSGSIFVDGRVLNDTTKFENDITNMKIASQEQIHNTKVSLENKVTVVDRKSSNIPVFSPRKMGESEVRENRISNYLPEVVYKEKENILSTSLYNQQKGRMIVKSVSTDSGRLHGMGRERDPPAHVKGADTLWLKDSAKCPLVEKQENKKERSMLEKVLSKESRQQKHIVKESSVDSNSSESQTRCSSSVVVDRPSSCLKVPGSPSLRAKHVTFAHRLVQQDKTLNDKIRKSDMPENSQELDEFNDETLEVCVTHEAQISPRGAVERSDLQVVPCREGDTQVASTNLQRSNSQTVESGPDQRGPPGTKNTENTKSDLIMAFSWMNQNSGSDTPCVSFIDQKQITKETEKSNKETHGSHAKDTTRSTKASTSQSPEKKSRKFRSRLAANFHLK